MLKMKFKHCVALPVACMLACAPMMADEAEAELNEALEAAEETGLGVLQPDSLLATEPEEFLLPDVLNMMHFDESLPENAYNSTWTHFVVNPYDTNLHHMKDSICIDMSGYCHPIPGFVTSRFGMRSYRYHYGTDVRLSIGDTIRAAFDGVVRISKPGYGYGNYILIRHFNGLETIYGHCSRLLVPVDSMVKAGQPIALGGNTGRSTGPHLHFEMRYVGNPIDPQRVVNFETGQPYNDTYIVCADTYKYKTEIAAMAFYTVRKGDTLSGIAKKRHTTVSKLCKLNKITPKTILRVGRRLRCA